MMKPEHEQEFELWKSSLSEMTEHELMHQYQMVRKAAGTPPTNGLIDLGGNALYISTDEWKSGSMFTVFQLIRSEMSRRGIAVPGVER